VSAFNLGTAIYTLLTDATKFDAGLEGAKGKTKSFGMVAAGVAGAGVGALTSAMGQLAKEAAEEEVGIIRLSTALQAVGVEYDEVGEAIERKIAAQTKSFAFADDKQRDSLTRLVAVTHNVGDAFKLQGLAMDLARARGIDLVTATDAVIKVSQGRYKLLQQLGIEIDDNMTKEQALAKVQETVAGQAEAYGKTTAANVDRFGIAVGNLRETIGGLLGPASSMAIIFQSTGLKGVLAAGGIASLGRALVSTTKGVHLFGIALRLTPLGLLITGLTLLGVGLKVAYDRFEGVRNVVAGLGDVLKRVIPGFQFIAGLAGDAAKALGLVGDEASETGDDLGAMGERGKQGIFSIRDAIAEVSAAFDQTGEARSVETFLKRYGADKETIDTVKAALMNMTGLTQDQQFKEGLDQDYEAIRAGIERSILEPVTKARADIAKMTEEDFAALAKAAGRVPEAHMRELRKEWEAEEARFKHVMANIGLVADNALKSTDLNKKVSPALTEHRNRIHELRDAWNEARFAADAYGTRIGTVAGGWLNPLPFIHGDRGSAMPEMATGGVVERTGVALVHQGETVLPAGSSPVSVAMTLNYSGDGAAGMAERMASDVLDAVTEALRQQNRRIGIGVA